MLDPVTLKQSYSQTTERIRITVKPEPIVENSDPDGGVYAFSYTITIENLGEESAQLLERHWIVMSGDLQIAEVVGSGVVGQLPIVDEGQSYEYTSGTVLQDPVGSMHGSYTFRSKSGRFFTVEIPKFELLFPVVVH